MQKEKPEITLLRTISAEILASLQLQASRDLFGKSYYSLSFEEEEKEAVHNTVGNHIFKLIQVMGSWEIPKSPRFLSQLRLAARAQFSSFFHIPLDSRRLLL